MSGILVAENAENAENALWEIAFRIHLAVETITKVVAVFREPVTEPAVPVPAVPVPETGKVVAAVAAAITVNAELVADYVIVAQVVPISGLMIVYNYRDRIELLEMKDGIQ